MSNNRNNNRLNPITELIFGISFFFIGALMFIGGIIDPNLPVYWKIMVCIIGALLMIGTYDELKDRTRLLKQSYANKEDLR